MAKVRKRRKPKKKPPQMSKRDRIYKRKRSFSEKFLLIMGIIIAISMVLSLIIVNAGSF